jgi:ubiquinol-cytochrome c reductase iron-sulfur subunit
MSEQGNEGTPREETRHGGTIVDPSGSDPRVPARVESGHPALPDRFPNPGLPTHVHRLSDQNVTAGRRAERQVATMFGASMVGTLIFLIAYFAIDYTKDIFIPGIGSANLLHLVLGVSLGVALLGIGFGAVHWAKTLMPDTEIVEERHLQRSSDEDRKRAADLIIGGGEAAQLGRRPILKYTLGGALALFGLPFIVQVAGSMGNPTQIDQLSETLWDIKPNPDGSPGAPIRLLRDPELTPVRASDVTIGSVFHIMPETLKDSQHVLEDKGKAAVLLMRLDPSQFAADEKGQKAQDWGYQGIVAYSKVCTHVGCAVGLYEQQTHHLLCPCHQSTFDVTRDCEVIFGPAKRPLPQLKITVDGSGYLVATQGFREPVGPSFWERNEYVH